MKLKYIMDEADKALYQAKSEGRNRIHTNCQGYPMQLNEKVKVVQRVK